MQYFRNVLKDLKNIEGGISIKVKLFCIPYAGGSASFYYKWRKIIPSSIELCPIELAGRGKRVREPFYNSLNEAVDDIFNNIVDKINETPYAILGHSMGSWIVFELYYKIKKAGLKEPMHIFFSGRYPPHIKKAGKVFYKLPDEEFKQEILKIGETPVELFEDKVMASTLISVLKADFKILETYEFLPKNELINCNVTIFNGKEDADVTNNDLKEWLKYSSKQCDIYEFEGGHFFINLEKESVIKIISNKLI